MTTYQALSYIIAPFDGAYRVSTLAKDKILPGHWSLHRRKGARPGEAGGYYLVWIDGIR